MSDSTNKPSAILLDELYASCDDGFVEQFLEFNSAQKLESFVEKWKKDTQPWARDQVKRYFAEPMDRPGHEVVVKRLFKHGEAANDDEWMGWCMVAFDRLVRRRRVSRYRYDWRSRRGWQEEALVSPPNKTVQETPARQEKTRNPFTGREFSYMVPAVRNKSGNRLFTYATRHYIRRRAWRYFRRLGYMHPERYVPAIAKALALYTDDDFAKGENIIDNWSMMHACYFNHPAISFTVSYIRLDPEHNLGELYADPYHLELWKQTEAFDELMKLLTDAQSSLIRLWTLEMIREYHAEMVKSLTPEKLIPLLDHPDTRVQEFAADTFGKLDGLGSLRIETWLSLLEGSNVSALALICDAMKQHVSIDRLDNDQLLTFACARPAPVARMGFDMLKERHGSRPFSPQDLLKLADVQCVSMGRETSQWVLSQIATHETYAVDHVSPLFDSLKRPTRDAAMEWLDHESPGWNDPQLWARLIETPFDDIRMNVVQRLEQREKLPGNDMNALAPVWTSVILGVHRGGRRKPDALRQIIRAMLKDEAKVLQLLPVLAVAVRSIRGPERRAGLAAVAELAERAPQHESLIAQAIPELQLETVTEDAA